MGIALALAYPFAIYAGFKLFRPTYVAAGVGVLAVLRLAARGKLRRTADALKVSWQSVALVALAVAAVWFQRERLVLLVPALINLGLLITFGRSVARPPSLAERFARIHAADLTPEEVRYCRTVTLVWCVFFVVNGTLSILTALRSLEAWALYNGFLAYIAMGILFGIELTYRYWRFRRYEGAATDALFRWLFPPKGQA